MGLREEWWGGRGRAEEGLLRRWKSDFRESCWLRRKLSHIVPKLLMLFLFPLPLPLLPVSSSVSNSISVSVSDSIWITRLGLVDGCPNGGGRGDDLLRCDAIQSAPNTKAWFVCLLLDSANFDLLHLLPVN